MLTLSGFHTDKKVPKIVHWQRILTETSQIGPSAARLLLWYTSRNGHLRRNFKLKPWTTTKQQNTFQQRSSLLYSSERVFLSLLLAWHWLYMGKVRPIYCNFFKGGRWRLLCSPWVDGGVQGSLFWFRLLQKWEMLIDFWREWHFSGFLYTPREEYVCVCAVKWEIIAKSVWLFTFGEKISDSITWN